MNFVKEVEFEKPLFSVKLENGVFLFVYEGYADGSDGKTYYHIGTENDDGELVTLGWSSEADKPTII